MAPLRTFVALALTSALAVAAPALRPRDGDDAGDLTDFVLHQVEVGDGFIRSGPLARYHVFTKYAAEVPHGVIKAQQSNNGSVQAIPEVNDREFLVPVSIGSSGKVLNMNIDTGSSDFWVFSSDLPQEDLSGHSFYDPSASSTSKKLSGATWQILYGDNSQAGGDVYIDKVALGGVTAAQQAVQAATTANGQLTQDLPCDGIIGAGFSSGNQVRPHPQQTFLDNVKAGLAQPVMAVDLRRNAPGSFQFGATDPSKYHGPITTTDVDFADGRWSFTAAGYAVGGDAVTALNLPLVADTGSSGLYLPDPLVNAYYKRVSGAKVDDSVGGWVFPCSAQLPDLNIQVGKYKATMPGSYNNFASNDGSTCFGAIQSSEGIGVNIIGDSFLKSQYVVFNAGSPPTIGFAAKFL